MVSVKYLLYFVSVAGRRSDYWKECQHSNIMCLINISASNIDKIISSLLNKLFFKSRKSS